MVKTISKNNPKKTFFTVGPSQIYPTVPKHMENAISRDIWSISHRGSEFKEIYKSATDGLRELLNIPENYEIVFLSSALEAMERVTQSMSHNNSFHILSGFFGKTWMGISKDLGKSPESFQFFDWDQNLISDLDFKNIKIPAESELVCITQNDTSTGFSIPMSEIYALRKNYTDKLFALDVVSSVPYVDIEYRNLDAVFFSVQKGFGLPAGLSVLILSPNSLKKAEKLSQIPGYSIGSYHNLIKLSQKSRELQINETPNVLGIYLLDCVVRDFLKIGLSDLRTRLDDQAHMLYSFFSKPEYYNAYIKQEQYQSKTTPVFEIVRGSESLRKFAAEKGLILGAGYPGFKNKQSLRDESLKHLRIANFPALTKEDLEKVFKTLRTFKN